MKTRKTEEKWIWWIMKDTVVMEEINLRNQLQYFVIKGPVIVIFVIIFMLESLTKHSNSCKILRL